MPETVKAGHLCTTRKLMATVSLWNCFWTTMPMPRLRTGAAIYRCTTRNLAGLRDCSSHVEPVIDVPANGGWTPLHSAAAGGQVAKAEFLLAKAAYVNVKNQDADTPLRVAESKGNDEMAELLRKHGGWS
jgi:hypothetical protein